jgi:hypothetical protein
MIGNAMIHVHYKFVCDRCHVAEYTSANPGNALEAVDHARANGWRVSWDDPRGSATTVCPKCKLKELSHETEKLD